MKTAGMFIRANGYDALYCREIVYNLSPVCLVTKIPDDVALETIVDMLRAQKGCNWDRFGHGYHQFTALWQPDWPHDWRHFDINVDFNALLRGAECDSVYAA